MKERDKKRKEIIGEIIRKYKERDWNVARK